jgi:ADP-ribose pyrophosphatase YjhB (NUDIX family)
LIKFLPFVKVAITYRPNFLTIPHTQPLNQVKCPLTNNRKVKMVWKPHVTVAAIIERNQRFLVVEEETGNGLEFNQPAGHLEQDEDLICAVKREVTEETAWQFEPSELVSVQLWRKNPDFPTFMRFCFTGHCYSHNPEQRLDAGIVKTHWLTRAEIAAQAHRLRSPLVLFSIDQYLSGQRYPLDLLHSFIDLDHA